MKRRRSPAWSFTRRRHQITEAPAAKRPVQLAMFVTEEERIAETPQPPLTVHEGRSTAVIADAPSTAPEPVLLISDDGAVEFRLLASETGVTLTRTHRRTRHERVDMSIAFRSEAGFLQWCDADHLRHAYPLLFTQLRRSGCALFDRVG